jgi:hypothetical protein
MEAPSAAQKAAMVCLRDANRSRRSTHLRVAVGSYVERMGVSIMGYPLKNETNAIHDSPRVNHVIRRDGTLKCIRG